MNSALKSENFKKIGLEMTSEEYYIKKNGRVKLVILSQISPQRNDAVIKGDN